MANLELLVTLKDQATAQLRALNGEIKANQIQWRDSLRATGIAARQLGVIMAGLGASIMAPLAYAIKSALDSIDDALEKSKEKIDVYYADGITIKKTVNNSGYSESELAGMQAVQDQMNDLKKEIAFLAGDIGRALLPVILSLVQAVTPIIQTISNWIILNPQLATQLLTIALVVGTVVSALAGALGVIAVVALAFGSIAGPVGWAILAIIALSAVITAVVMNWSTIVEGLKTATFAVANFLSMLVENFINSIIEMINLVPNAINAVSGLVGGSVSVPTVPKVSLPRLASGGIVSRPTLAMIGEAGPEAVVPLRSGGGGMVTNHYWNVEGSVITENQLWAAMRQKGLVEKSRNFNAGLA
jgi:hypothetical protein